MSSRKSGLASGSKSSSTRAAARCRRAGSARRARFAETDEPRLAFEQSRRVPILVAEPQRQLQTVESAPRLLRRASSEAVRQVSRLRKRKPSTLTGSPSYSSSTSASTERSVASISSMRGSSRANARTLWYSVTATSGAGTVLGHYRARKATVACTTPGRAKGSKVLEVLMFSPDRTNCLSAGTCRRSPTECR